MKSYPPPEIHRLALFHSIEVKRWDPEELPPKGQAAFDRFLALTPDALSFVAPHVFAYYQDMMAQLDGKGWPGVSLPNIDTPEGVWEHVEPVSVMVQSAGDDDGPWYVGVEAKIPWEVAHGLIMFWEDGIDLAKVGRVDGHVTNANSYADPNLENVVYAAFDPKFMTVRRKK